ncbi:MAG TPA: DUF1491 family protein [Sphingomicrobium sp.]|nr:DUF1491 family protein [Sphingomicrobium sp.]
MSRLATAVEAAALIRRAEASGDFATVIRKGDPERGSLLLVITSRGMHAGCLERMLTADGSYQWRPAGPAAGAESAQIGDFLRKRARFDEDLWLIELDVAQAERFIAETTYSA